MEKNTLNNLIVSAYESISHQNGFSSFLNLTTEIDGISGATIFTSDSFELQLNKANYSDSLQKEHFVEYVQNFGSIDSEVYDGFHHKVDKQAFYTLEDILKIMYQDRMYKINYEKLVPVDRFLKERLNVFQRASAVLNNETGKLDILSFLFDEMPDSSCNNMLEQFKLLPQHVAKASELHRPFQLLQERFNAICSVLNYFYLGVVVLDTRGRIILANDSAERMLSNKDGIHRSTRGELLLTNSGLRSQFDRFLNDLSEDQPATYSINMTLPRAQGKSDVFVDFSLSNPEELNESKRVVIGVLVDPDHDDIVNIEGVKMLYGLTPAESQITELLVQNHTNQEIADIRSVTVDAVKFHLKSIFNKTLSSSRTDLVRLAHKVSLPIKKT